VNVIYGCTQSERAAALLINRSFSPAAERSEPNRVRGRRNDPALRLCCQRQTEEPLSKVTPLANKKKRTLPRLSGIVAAQHEASLPRTSPGLHHSWSSLTPSTVTGITAMNVFAGSNALAAPQI
jgi:hypothetical protein